MPYTSSPTDTGLVRPVRYLLSAFALALALVATSACGGSSSESANGDSTTTISSRESTTTSESTTTTAGSTTTESTTTTVAPRAEADQASKDLASAAVLQGSDFGEGWIEYSAGDRFTPTEESCAYEAGGPEDTLLAGAALSGPIMQLGDQPGFVSSRAYAFPTEEAAVAFVEITKGSTWSECEVKTLQKFQDDNNADVSMSLATRDIETLGESGFEAYAEFSGVDADGNLVYVVTKSAYRLGRTVIITTDENGGVAAEDTQLIGDGTYAALSAAYARVNSLG